MLCAVAGGLGVEGVWEEVWGWGCELTAASLSQSGATPLSSLSTRSSFGKIDKYLANVVAWGLGSEEGSAGLYEIRYTG